MEKSLIIFLFVCVATSFASFELPMILDIGYIPPGAPRIDHQVQAFGPFVTPRNLTFHFEWSTESHVIGGVRLRGSEPRYDRISVTLNRLQTNSYSIDISVIDTTFSLFWAEPHGFPITPTDSAKEVNN
ncbi:CLUMA_CG002397, isoform A [Clunio marinus]|uniref:CLUMA_CG002397, isoform A n=1 Tax=Clunio marinus TaxID=568069 RepID=A0A1J1HMN2_9DIPT|nr:CLUMA_CG002397, isoform A [Clunio marinus]